MSSFLEKDGKKYISSKEISKIWNLSQKTVAKYCRDKRIKDCIKGPHGQWYIFVETVKPLSDSEIHRLLFLTLQLKNNPSLEIDWSTFGFDLSYIGMIYSNLVGEGYLKPFECKDKTRIPYEVTLTQKGFELAIPSKTQKADISFTSAITQWTPIVIGVAQLIVQVAQMFSGS